MFSPIFGKVNKMMKLVNEGMKMHLRELNTICGSIIISAGVVSIRGICYLYAGVGTYSRD